MYMYVYMNHLMELMKNFNVKCTCIYQLMYQLYKHIKRLHYKNKNNLSFRIVH